MNSNQNSNICHKNWLILKFIPKKKKGDEYPGQFSRTKMEDFLYYMSRPTIKIE